MSTSKYPPNIMMPAAQNKLSQLSDPVRIQIERIAEMAWDATEDVLRYDAVAQIPRPTELAALRLSARFLRVVIEAAILEAFEPQNTTLAAQRSERVRRLLGGE